MSPSNKFCPQSRVCYKNSQKVTQHKIAPVEFGVLIVEPPKRKVHLVDIGSNFQFFLSFSQSSILWIAFIRMSSLLIHVLSLSEMGAHPYDVKDRFLNNDCLCLHLHGPLSRGNLLSILRNTEAVCHIIFQLKARCSFIEDDCIMSRDCTTCIG